jgi:hypothetical protein
MALRGPDRQARKRGAARPRSEAFASSKLRPVGKPSCEDAQPGAVPAFPAGAGRWCPTRGGIGSSNSTGVKQLCRSPVDAAFRKLRKLFVGRPFLR